MKYLGKNKKNLLVGVGIVALAVVSVIAITVFVKNQPPGTMIVVEHTPRKAKVFIDGSAKSSKTKVLPGEHKIAVSMDGFETFVEEVNVKEGEVVTVYAVLNSNAYYTANWYDEHPEDDQLKERLIDRSYIAQGEKIKKNFPIMDMLPYVGPRGAFQVDYGKSTKEDTQAIYISYYTDVGREKAEQWIVDQGYKLDDFEIIYRQKEYGGN